MSLAVAANAPELLQAVREKAASMDGGESWQEAAGVLAAALQVDVEEAEALLAKQFGWKGWFELNKAAYLKPRLPDPEQIRKAVTWLAGAPLHLKPEQLRAALTSRSKGYLSDPEALYNQALAAAPPQFSSPDAFRELVLREPIALQLTWNCENTDPKTRGLGLEPGADLHCDGQCVNCWRTALPRFEGKVLDGLEV